MFDFFKKKIPISQVNEGSHGDHWSAVFGFEEDVSSSVMSLVEGLDQVGPAIEGRVRLRSDHDLLSIYGISDDEGLSTLYPGLSVTESIPVELRGVKEWAHVDGIEGQIEGSGRDTFGIDFFALDYLEHKTRYRAGGRQDIALSGLAYVLNLADEMPENFSPDFCSYMPNTDMPCGHDYNLIGKTLSIESHSILGEDFLLLRIKLIHDEENPEMFNLPILVNCKNVQCETIKVGDKVSGCFWLHGRYAED